VDIRVYLAKGEIVRHVSGEMIFKRGEPGDVMYVVKDGEVTITYGEGQTVPVEAGESFGEMALIDGHVRSADAVASTAVELYPVDRSLFLVLVQDTPFFALEVMKSLTDRLRRANTVVG
jgi:CRP/FNR family transcriptional regulator, cyclic AMP receptor protein